ncbi:MAG: glycosyl hydrolase [Pseudomonadota bacterium]
MMNRRALVLAGLGLPLGGGARAELDAPTERLRAWLRTARAQPALGAQWNGGSKSVGWRDQAAISGRLPLVFGIEYYDDGPPERRRDAQVQASGYIQEHAAAGGVVTINDHMPNLLTGGNSWDRSADALQAVLPGGMAHGNFVAYLDRLADFIGGLQVNGQAVPVLLRPFHEMNGAWFWWGDANDGRRIGELWRFTHGHLVQTRKLRNLLWVWSPNIDRRASVDRFMGYWPGRAYVDVVGVDGYENAPQAALREDMMVRSVQALRLLARNQDLPFAVTEVGFQGAAQRQADFWDTVFQPALSGLFAGAAYVLVWNAEHGPSAGTPAAAGFARLVQSGRLLLRGDVPGEALYGAWPGRR